MTKKILPCLIGLALSSGVWSSVAATNVVVIGNFFFNPTNLTINLGDTVLWTNAVTATATHDTTSTNAAYPWASGDLNAAKRTFSLTFTNAGTFTYMCARHVLASMPAQRHTEQTGRVFVVTANLPPSVALTNPVNDARFRAPTNLLLQAAASDDGSVTNVAFFSGGTLLGSDTTAPYNFTVNGLPAGNYAFTARAQDNGGLSTTSGVVNVFVLTNASLTAPVVLPNGQFRLTVQGIAGQAYATEVSSDFLSWSALATNVAPANTFNVTDTTATNVLRRFYRTRQDL